MKFSHHPTTRAACVRYFYLPASKERYAEVIEVLNSKSDLIRVPMREEDLDLKAFFVRPLSSLEVETYKKAETWKLFSSWEEIEHDHYKFGLQEELTEELLQFKSQFELHEELAA